MRNRYKIDNYKGWFSRMGYNYHHKEKVESTEKTVPINTAFVHTCWLHRLIHSVLARISASAKTLVVVILLIFRQKVSF